MHVRVVNIHVMVTPTGSAGIQAQWFHGNRHSILGQDQL